MSNLFLFFSFACCLVFVHPCFFFPLRLLYVFSLRFLCVESKSSPPHPCFGRVPFQNGGCQKEEFRGRSKMNKCFYKTALSTFIHQNRGRRTTSLGVSRTKVVRMESKRRRRRRSENFPSSLKRWRGNDERGEKEKKDKKEKKEKKEKKKVFFSFVSLSLLSILAAASYCGCCCREGT